MKSATFLQIYVEPRMENWDVDQHIKHNQHSKAFVQPSCIDRNIGTVLRDEAWKPAWKIASWSVLLMNKPTLVPGTMRCTPLREVGCLSLTCCSWILMLILSLILIITILLIIIILHHLSSLTVQHLSCLLPSSFILDLYLHHPQYQ